MAENGLNRLEQIQTVVDEILHQQPDLDERRAGFIHLYGVSSTCVLLALKRGLDPELSAAAGMLHDIWTYKTGDPTNHARLGAPEAARILSELGSFDKAEIDQICEAIERHSDKTSQDGSLCEVLKDADVLQHYLYNPSMGIRPLSRLAHILAELGIAI